MGDGGSVLLQRHGRVPARIGARAFDGEGLSRPRTRDVNPHHSAVHFAGNRRSGLGADPAAAFRSDELHLKPDIGL